jgi:hypothetical protein
VRLSKDLSAIFLIRNVDKLTVPLVTQQLRQDRALLHWYLHTLFSKIPEVYNTQEYSDFHVMQVGLYAEFAPKFVRSADAVGGGGGVKRGSVCMSTTPQEEWKDNPEIVLSMQKNSVDSDFLTFLKTNNFAPLELALRECEKRRPPLYPEIIYILARNGNKKEALSLLLREVGDVYQAVDFVENHDQGLWGDLVDYGLQHEDFLTKLLDYVGICNLNPVILIEQIPKKTKIPYLRQRVLRILRQYGFQVFVNESCNGILEQDTLSLLRQLNQGQRRAVKVEPGVRCAICARPLSLPPVHTTNTNNSSSSSKDILGADVKVWGPASMISSRGGAVIFSNKLSVHRECFVVSKKV